MAIDRTLLNAMVNDPGDNLSGTLMDKAKFASVFFDPIDDAIAAEAAARAAAVAALGPGTSVVTTTGNIAALPIPAGTGPLTIYMANATLATIQGIVAGIDGQSLAIISIGAGQVDANHQDAAATAARRLIHFVTSGTVPGKTSAAAGVGNFLYRYDADAAHAGANPRWRLTHHAQGAKIAVPYVAGHFTATAGTWTLPGGAANVQRHEYYLREREMTEYLEITGSSVSNNGVHLISAIPLGFTAGGRAMRNNMYRDAGGAYVMGGSWISAAGQAVIGHYGAAFNAAFNIAVGNTELYVTMDYDVQ